MNCQNEEVSKNKAGMRCLKAERVPMRYPNRDACLSPSDAGRHPKESHSTNRNNSPDLQYSLKYRDAARCTIE